MLITKTTSGQFVFNGQLIERGEYRHGYGSAIDKEADPAAFISQRLRLEGSYKLSKLTFYTSIQDVRTWGSTSQLNISDNAFSLHEAWAHIQLDTNFSLKVGRQELVYDNSRFLGNVDWALQGRSHDFALLKWVRKNTKIDIGAGYNQDGEALSGNILTVTNQYKTALLFRVEQKLGNFDFSFLVWNDGRQYTKKDSVGNVTDDEIRYSLTIGLPTIRYKLNNTTFSGSFYNQSGKDVKNNTISAIEAGLQVAHVFKFNESKGTQLKITLGGEYLSGTASDNTSTTNNSFAPLYGTNHMHNGYMDQFYVAGRHENSVGLIDGYLKFKYDFSSSAFIGINGNMFNAANEVYNTTGKMDSYLGTEIDFTAGYVLDKSISFQLGYSQMFGTATIQHLQKAKNPDSVQNWAYLMLIIRPNSDKKFIGLYN
ncbi:MAG: alginate export family protein [Bacteroidetes bacterium]|nr:alginate export family protein [Bacteroidota bacterium]